MVLSTAVLASSELDSLYNAYIKERNESKKTEILLKYANELKYQNIDSAFVCVGIAYSNAVSLKSELLQAEAAIQFAKCEEYKSNYRAALKYAFMAANLFRKNKDKPGLAKTYTSMGVIYWYQGLYRQAIDYFQKNILLSTELNDQDGLAASYGNLAIIFDEEGKLDSSLAYYNKALKIYSSTNNQTQLASCYDNMSIVFLQYKDFNKAIEYHAKGFDLRKKNADTVGIMASLENLGTIYLRQNKPDKAIEVSKEVVKMANRRGAKEDLKYALINLKDAYALKKDFASAFEYQKKLLWLKDSLRNKEINDQIAELEARYNNEEKRKELSEIKFEQKLKEKENENSSRKKNYAIITLMIGGIAFLVVTFLIFKRYKEKQKVAEVLEKKNEAINKQKKIIDKAYRALEEINTDITDSIKYAKRIQEVIFPPQKLIDDVLPQSFVLFKPKDIVSGDFYWMEKVGNYVYFAVVDCTGHGVPGAFMSIVGHNLLNKAIHEYKCVTTSEILNQVNKGLYDILRQTVNDMGVRDGMEITLCRWEKAKGELMFSGANHVMYGVSNNELFIHKGDKHPIDAFYDSELKQFSQAIIKVNKGDVFYLTSDGYADQFGGPTASFSKGYGSGKKFKSKQLQEIFLSIHTKEMNEQKAALNSIFYQWRGELEQVDDILIFGVKF
ncbi:MAG: tetratricopeptide repeat protein [Bacteroidota bacterium]|nr:tetratricopeptide repeat protein [Bacteroidota bacterium]